MLWNLFILDFDGTYDNESYGNEQEEVYGVMPSVYLIPAGKECQIKRIAYEAERDFLDAEDDQCIGDYFEEKLELEKIPFQFVGSLEIPFDERQKEYLADYIPRVIV